MAVTFYFLWFNIKPQCLSGSVFAGILSAYFRIAFNKLDLISTMSIKLIWRLPNTPNVSYGIKQGVRTCGDRVSWELLPANLHKYHFGCQKDQLVQNFLNISALYCSKLHYRALLEIPTSFDILNLTICICMIQFILIKYNGIWGQMILTEGKYKCTIITIGSDCHIANRMPLTSALKENMTKTRASNKQIPIILCKNV